MPEINEAVDIVKAHAKTMVRNNPFWQYVLDIIADWERLQDRIDHMVKAAETKLYKACDEYDAMRAVCDAAADLVATVPSVYAEAKKDDVTKYWPEYVACEAAVKALRAKEAP
jgi:hypothetical protein